MKAGFVLAFTTILELGSSLRRLVSMGVGMYDVSLLSNFYPLPNGQIIKDLYRLAMLLEYSRCIKKSDREIDT